jgi:hypothetical protein
MNPQVQHKDEDVCRTVCESAPESAKVTSVVRDEAMEKLLSLWISEMVSDKKSVVDTITLHLKAKQIY